MTRQEGGCLCGALRYAVMAPPQRVTFCHCRFCQRATGSAFLVEPIFAKSDFAITRGTAATYDHQSEGSGKRVTIHFCGTCGTKILLSFERFEDVVGVYGGTFDDPNWFERSGEAAKHIFLDAAQHGTVIPPGVNTYREHAMTNADEPVDPAVFEKPHVIGS